MDDALRARRSKQDFLLIPMMPTPNGRLHLGHISGPYLKLDVLARHFRRRGDRALVLCGSDVHDSFVLLKASQTRKTPQEICRHFHQAIQRDLQSLQIECAAYLNPLGKDKRLYEQSIRSVVRQLIENDRTEIRSELVLYAPEKDRWIVGCWLEGECPSCGKPAGSYFCESCGISFRPEQMKNSHARVELGRIEPRDIRCLNMRISDPDASFKRLASIGVSDDFVAIARRYVDLHGPSLRLTQPSGWGIPWRVEGETTPQVVYSYAGTWGYAIACGEVFKRKVRSKKNAFSPDSKVTIIGACGIDNAVPVLFGWGWGGFEHGGVKPFDHLLLNQFLRLEGSKFSTSRGHAIWAADIVEKAKVDSDAVRIFLALNNPERTSSNFDLHAFQQFVDNELAGKANAALRLARSRLQARVRFAVDGDAARQVGIFLERQERAFDPGSIDLAGGAEVFMRWIDDCPRAVKDAASAYAWLKGLALIGYPLCPRTSTAVWELLGHRGVPTLAKLTAATSVSDGVLPEFRSIRRELLRRALPRSMRQTV
jgi:methionyl-tRNA synthetase